MEIKPRTTISIVAEHCELLIYRLNEAMKSDFVPQDKTDKTDNLYTEGQIAAYEHIIKFVRGL